MSLTEDSGASTGRAMRIVRVVAVIVGFPSLLVLLFVSNTVVWEPVGLSENAATVEMVLAVAAAGLGCGAYAIFRSRGADDRLRPAGWGLVAVAAALTFGLVGVDIGRREAQRLIADYCAYGAQSQSQLATCKEHVSFNDVDRRETPAARFAKDPDTDCGADAGPFCRAAYDRRVRRLLEEMDR